ncbi:hypothetical protein [Synechococcus sp. CS-1328]|nr:hypothetical protein [Synechococcus sp. CS-1328]
MVGRVLTGNGDLSDREYDQRHADVFGDMAEQGRSDIAAVVH